MQLSVVAPHESGCIVTPADPAATTDAGISVALLLVTEKCSGPVPLIVIG
jgi:hypothetical protein